MDIRFTQFWCSLIALSATLSHTTIKGQGTINFDARNNWIGTYYVELGIAFQVVLPRGGMYDYMGIGLGAGNTPYNGTPWMGWIRQNNPYSYVSLNLTNGSLFGFSSVDLADPIAPSYSQLPITFLGFKPGGLTVTNTFTTPGGGASSFLTYQFGPDFASDLLSVRIDAPRWAMDNLRWVPEPSTYALLTLGLLALAWGRFNRRGKLRMLAFMSVAANVSSLILAVFLWEVRAD